MKNIKSFDALFPNTHKRYMSFLEKTFVSQIDKEINDIIEESYGISEDVIDIVNKLVSYIEGDIKYNETFPTQPFNFNYDIGIKPNFYEISSIYKINNLTFDVDCNIINYSNITDDDFNMVSTLNVEAQTQGITSDRFKIICSIPVKDFIIGKIGKRVLSHEIMHTWQHHKKNSGGKKEKEYPEWRSLYNTSISVLRKNNDDTIAKAIYYSDLKELAAFTQQAYYDIKDISDSNTVHNEIKKLDIYKGVNNIKSAIDFLENNELPDDFNIGKKNLLKIFKKRYYQYKKNISRLIISRKEIINEGVICFDSTPLDWLYINKF